MGSKDINQHAIDIYDQIAEEYSAKYDDKESDEDLILLKPFLTHLKPNSYIVDLGCGTGFSSGYFVKNGMRGEGTDLSSSMIKIAKRNYPNITFSVANMLEFTPDNKVDAVWAGYSLFHFEQKDFESTLKKIRTYLKLNGLLAIVMQEGDGEIFVGEPLLPNETIYLHLYTEDQLRKILDNHGFKIIEVKRKLPMYPIEFPYNKLLIIAKLV